MMFFNDLDILDTAKKQEHNHYHYNRLNVRLQLISDEQFLQIYQRK